MVEKDIEFAIKQAIDIKTSAKITITNEYRSDGIIRVDGNPIAIIEFKCHRNFINETTRTQILCQLICYYRKLVDKEHIDPSAPFFFIMGDENEIYIINAHKIDFTVLLNKKWLTATPSSAYKDEELFNLAAGIAPGFYYKYEKVEELYFGFKMLFSSLFFNYEYNPFN